MEELVYQIRRRYLDVFSNHLSAYEGDAPIYICDLIIFGLMDRNIGLVEAMPKLINDENIHALAPLLRIQLDGLLRLHAFRLVEKPDELAKHVIKGKELRDFKDKNNKRMTDRNLVNSVKQEFPWVESMYNELNGWVHFSNSHIFVAATEGNKEGSIYIGIGNFRQRITPELFHEAIEAIKEIHSTTAGLIEAYFRSTRSV